MFHQDLASGRSAFPIATIRLGMMVMIALILASIGLNWKIGRSIREAVSSEVAIVSSARRVADYGVILEMSVKAATANGDPDADAKYRQYQPALRSTLTDLRRRLAPTTGIGVSAAGVDRADLALIRIEYRALDLARRGDLATARQLIESDEYYRLVRAYEEGIRAVERSALGYAHATEQRIRNFLALVVVVSGASLILVLIGWYSLIRPARRWGDQLNIARAGAEFAAARLRDQQGELEVLNQRLFAQARVDPLTGLNSRLSFNEDAESTWTAVDPAPSLYCAVMCDVDFFKQYNDSCGHLPGDRVLRQVAEALQSELRPGERAYRLGGEEFLVVIEAACLAAAAARAEGLRAAVAGLDCAHPASPLGKITISIGVAAFVFGPGMTTERWLTEADRALYEAKAGGRNQVRVVEPPGRVEPAA